MKNKEKTINSSGLICFFPVFWGISKFLKRISGFIGHCAPNERENVLIQIKTFKHRLNLDG